MSGRKRPTVVRDGEKADIRLLARAGYTISRIASMLDRSEATIARVLDEPKAELREKFEAPLLDAYLASATVAAESGDHRPALEMLDRLGIIPETSRQRTALATAQITADAQRALVASGVAGRGDRTGPTVNIGIGLPGQLGPSSVTIEPGLFTPELPQKTGESVSKVHTLQGQVVQVVDKAGQ